MKRALSLILVLVLCLTALAACGSSDTDADQATEAPSESASVNMSGVNQSSQEKGTKKGSSPAEQTPASPDSKTNLSDSFDGRSDIAYVMIYNPNLYSEYVQNNATVSTGDIGKWVNPDAKRADGLEDTEEDAVTTFSQGDLMAGVDIEPNLEEDRATVLLPSYSLGDRQVFYNDAIQVGSYTTQYRRSVFECIYEGKNCNVWLRQGESVDLNIATACGEEFDQSIYTKDTEMFGKHRYADAGAKINILLHDMDNPNVGGYFWPCELYTTVEVDSYTASALGINLNHAIIHVNTSAITPQYIQSAYATLAHEFQHLINFSAYFDAYSHATTSTWLNESMSAYAEEVQYPGIQYMDGRYSQYATSDLIRHGQSLYNFTTTMSGYSIDIGVYGSVFLFAEYISHIAGGDVYRRTLDYWRDSDSLTLCDEEALYNACGANVVKSIDDAIRYPSSIRFYTDEQMWMSKLTLSFYISLMKYDTSDPEAYRYVDARALLYDEINPARLEGGGRIIFATKNGKFEIPSNAGKNLVYIGFDKDFNQVTNPIWR